MIESNLNINNYQDNVEIKIGKFNNTDDIYRYSFTMQTNADATQTKHYNLGFQIKKLLRLDSYLINSFQMFVPGNYSYYDTSPTTISQCHTVWYARGEILHKGNFYLDKPLYVILEYTKV